jgi:ABC-type nitrate/sulfonate/bicarbonate transport system substrate-binding protein
MENSRINRRAFMGLGAASIVLLTSPQVSLAQQTRHIQTAFDWIPSSQYAGFFAGVRSGAFIAKNLAVDFTPGGPNAPVPLVLLSAGKADIAAATWLSTLDAIAKNNDFVIIGAEFPQSPGGILSLPSKPIRKAADINGKTMMIQDPSLSVIFDGMLAFEGLKPDYKVIPTGFSADPLFAGDGDGYLCFITNQPLELEAMGLVREKDFVLATFEELGYNIPETLMVVQRSYLTTKREQIVDYLEVLLRSWAAHDAHPDTDIQYIVDTYGQDYGLQFDLEKKKDRLQSKLTFAPGGQERLQIADAQFDKMYELAKLTGRTAANRDRIIDMSLLNEAAARLK